MSECSSVEKIYPEPVTEIRGPLFQLLFKMNLNSLTPCISDDNLRK